ncbi:MAG: restriction endonuclease [Hyphomicrobiales bacterium]|nr:restriction endonuclease [Hyphomicrobiales bacterium]
MKEIPDYQTLMLPVLRSAAGGTVTTRDAVERISSEFDLSDDDRRRVLPSGRGTYVYNRVHWAKTYLSKAGLLEATGRGAFRATERGLAVLKSTPKRIDNAFLSRYPEFVRFIRRITDDADVSALKSPKRGESDAERDNETPDDLLDEAIKRRGASLRDDLIERIMSIEPQATRARVFEKLVLKLLQAMGYGAGAGTARHVGGTGDGGVDGVIFQDALELDPVYLQAKCYARDAIVGPEQIQAFKGALDDKGATRGAFITTGKFSAKAGESGRKSQKQVALIDGDKLAELMERYDVGVVTARTLAIKELDETFFEDLGG